MDHMISMTKYTKELQSYFNHTISNIEEMKEA